MRKAGFAEGEHAYAIGERGIDVAFVDPQKLPTIVSHERVSSGVAQLDAMLECGLLRSTITLVSGLPGTAKSTIGASFIQAALRRGEQSLIVAFDEPAEQLVANMLSVGLQLGEYVQAGQLHLLSLTANGAIADEHIVRIWECIERFDCTCIVIDPVSALAKAGGTDVAVLTVERVAQSIRERGITAVLTALSNTQAGELEASSAHVSTIADTWIHLSYAARGGERNRTLTVVKSRGTAHSNQMREMILSGDGVRLEEVYDLQGELPRYGPVGAASRTKNSSA